MISIIFFASIWLLFALLALCRSQKLAAGRNGSDAVGDTEKQEAVECAAQQYEGKGTQG